MSNPDRKSLTRAEFEALPAAFYDCRDSENLSHECVEDAVEELVEALCEPRCDVGRAIRDHGPVTVNAYRRQEIAPNWIANTADCLSELLGERFAEDYGGPDDDNPEPSAQAQAALVQAVRIFVAEQRVWQCEPIGAYTYAVEEVEAMMREHCPDWFDECPTAAKRAREPG